MNDRPGHPRSDRAWLVAGALLAAVGGAAVGGALMSKDDSQPVTTKTTIMITTIVRDGDGKVKRTITRRVEREPDGGG